MWLILSLSPAWFTALTESPPPMTVVAPWNIQTWVFSLTACPTKSLVSATTEAIQMQAESDAIDRESSMERETKTMASENLGDHSSHNQFQMTTCRLEADPLQFHAKAGHIQCIQYQRRWNWALAFEILAGCLKQTHSWGCLRQRPACAKTYDKSQKHYLSGNVSQSLGNGVCAVSKGLHFKHTHGSIPDDRLGILKSSLELLHRLGSNVQSLYAVNSDMYRQQSSAILSLRSFALNPNSLACWPNSLQMLYKTMVQAHLRTTDPAQQPSASAQEIPIAKLHSLFDGYSRVWHCARGSQPDEIQLSKISLLWNFSVAIVKAY